MGCNGQKWEAARANAWWDEKDWACGFNFLPSSAVNFIELWHRDTFDKETIARELGWAGQVGFNALRVNLHYLVWKNDRSGLIDRMNWFLVAASKNGIDTMFVPFDDCGFGGFEPEYGPQPEPVPNIHNSRAVASPGRAAVMDRNLWDDFEAFVRDVIGSFKDDKRILLWDLYNEPGNLSVFGEGQRHSFDEALKEHSRDLMAATFEWARSVDPSHPLTVGAWVHSPSSPDGEPFENEIDQLALELSDVISFHAYCDRAHAELCIETLSSYGRPILNTEWMARTRESRFLDQLDLYHGRKVGCFNWGLVQGRTQTHLPQPGQVVKQNENGEDMWYHDVFKPDGNPYDPRETELINRLTSTKDSG